MPPARRRVPVRREVLAGRAAAALVAGAALAGCMSGRVLSGYPGYPFVRFDVPAPADSTFFALQEALRAEGFALDYTSRADGLLATRDGTIEGRPAFLNVVVGVPETDEDGSEPGETQESTGSRVWIAAWERRPAGAERLDPLREDEWEELVALSGRLSAAVGGGPTSGPPASGP